MTLTKFVNSRKLASMVEWLVELDGQQRRLDDIWSGELAKIAGPLRDSIDEALSATQSLDDLRGLKVVLYTEDGEWGFKLSGPRLAAHYATDLIGNVRQFGRTAN